MNEKNALAAGWLLVLSTFAGLCMWAAKLMFEYSLYTIAGRDVAWYLDLLGGLALSALNLPLFVICLIARHCDVATPFLS